MAANVGGIDRIARIVIGGGLIYYAMSNLPGAQDWMVPAGMVGFIVLLTGLFGRCFAYKLFGINTAKS